MSAYWKLWHDVRGRYLVALMIVGWQMFASGGPLTVRNSALRVRAYDVPTVCVSATPQVIATTDHSSWEYRTLSQYCSAGEVPRHNYARDVNSWTVRYQTVVWDRLMPVLLLFLGILLAVGAPFAGERAEAAALTFSLPLTRVDWVVRKIKISVAMLMSIIAFAYIAGALSYRFPGVDRVAMRGMNIDLQQITDTFPSIIASFVGLSLGITASMFSRSSLAGAVLASLVAYFLALVDWAVFTPNEWLQSSLVVMDMTQPRGALVALVVATGAIALTIVRLERTDF
jgi:hypothetical protein